MLNQIDPVMDRGKIDRFRRSSRGRESPAEGPQDRIEPKSAFVQWLMAVGPNVPDSEPSRNPTFCRVTCERRAVFPEGAGPHFPVGNWPTFHRRGLGLPPRNRRGNSSPRVEFAQFRTVMACVPQPNVGFDIGPIPDRQGLLPANPENHRHRRGSSRPGYLLGECRFRIAGGRVDAWRSVVTTL